MKIKFDIEGMTCAACQAHVLKAVEKLEGTKDVNVNLLQNTLTLDFDENLCSEKDIQEAVSKAGYKAILKTNIKEVQKRKDKDLMKLIICIVDLTILMYFSMGHMMLKWPVPDIVNMEKSPLGFSLIQLILVIPIVVIYNNFFVVGFKKLFMRAPNMDSLIAIGASVSLLYGIYCLFMIAFGHHEYHMYLYFESAGMILTLVSLGKYLEKVSKKKTTKAIEKLINLAPKYATIQLDGEEKKVAIDKVKVGDIVIIRNGDSIPVDGKIIEGAASIDQSNITGESIPVYKKVGQDVFSSTVVTAGFIKIEAKKVGEDTSISNIIKLVEEASNSKAPISKLVDKISGVFVPIVLVISMMVLIVNYIISKNFELALNFAITVLVIACPCALGLATPVAIMVGSGKGAEKGLLIKNAEILEKAHNIKVVVLDKTGTITEGKPNVVDFDNNYGENLLDYIYSIEYKSEHPLAKAICDFAKNNNAKILEVIDYKTIEGSGVIGKIDNKEIYIGNINGENINEDIKIKMKEYSSEGKTPLIIRVDNKIVGIITIKDKVKKYTKEAINLLKSHGIKVIMLTGDNEITAKAVAKEVGIDKVISNVLPQDKQKVINSLKEKNKLVAMVGDGVNDSLALTTADVGISLKGASDIAIDCADIVLLKNKLIDVMNVIALSKKTLITIKLGLFWAFFYNSICILLSTGFLYYINGFKMTPMIGSLAMSLSSVSVVLNALTINLFKPKKIEIEEELKMTNYKIIVEGMMCMHCQKRVNDIVLGFANVKNVDVSLENKCVTFQAEDNFDITDIVQAINNDGYKAKV